MNNWIAKAERIIGYTFINKSLLIQAFTHSSYTNENKNFVSYERLEFIGDAVLGYVIGVYLYNYYPGMREGELTKKRAGLVDQDTLSTIIEKSGLNKYLMVGAGNTKDRINYNPSVECDLFEAIIGAILLDSNMDINNAKTFILKNLESMVGISVIDYKTKLLEEFAKKNIKPEFVVLDKEKGFKIALVIEGKEICKGFGDSKKAAEKQASKNYFSQKK